MHIHNAFEALSMSDTVHDACLMNYIFILIPKLFELSTFSTVYPSILPDELHSHTYAQSFSRSVSVHI